MTAEPAFDPALAPVLRVFDVEPVAITPVPSGQVNQHWRIETGDGELFLRRYNQFRRPDAVAFEHAALEHAARRGWPVATAKPSAAGEAVVSYGDGRFSLFPALPGAPRRDTTRAHQRIKGRLLARFHRDMAVFAPDRQRDGFGRLWELDPVVQAAGAASFNDLLSRFGREHSALAAGVRRQRYRNLRELARLGYGDLAPAVIHGDFQRENLLFSQGEFTGLLDFDSIRLEAPVADVAASAWLDCLDPSGDRIDPAAAGALVEGYAAGRPLPGHERRMLPALIRAQMLWFVAFRLMQWSADRSAAPVQSIARTVNRRFPALDAVTPALERALVPAPAP